MMNKVAFRFRGSGYIASEDQHTIVNEILADFKRLWEGQEAKGTCQECGGSKRVPIPRKSLEQENKYWQDCPQCDGTGECKHVEYQQIHDGYSKPKCLSCKQEVERRSGSERREGILRRSMDVEKATHMGYMKTTMPKALEHTIDCIRSGTVTVDTGAHTGYVIIIDRRIKDRRKERSKVMRQSARKWPLRVADGTFGA